MSEGTDNLKEIQWRNWWVMLLWLSFVGNFDPQFQCEKTFGLLYLHSPCCLVYLACYIAFFCC
ncbi:hypothetical protein BJ742DRAFT_831401 [Cladochytrium replicatum]|nr:hypothetical protein BJ742DRAFT_831401 [Cladochytrium replicatum]